MNKLIKQKKIQYLKMVKDMKEENLFHQMVVLCFTLLKCKNNLFDFKN